MNRIVLLIAGVSALGLAACDHPDAQRQREARVPKTIAKLDCPERQGQLKRVSAATDGLSCAYEADGTEVVLTLRALNGGKPGEVLDGLKSELGRQMPAKPAETAAAAGSDGGEEVSINLPGVRIDARDEQAKIRVAGVEIDANDNRAEINIAKGVDDGGKEGVFAQYILADETGADWKVVGYQVRGPANGPLVAATVKSRREGSTDGLFEDVSDLLNKNVGGRTFKNVRIAAEVE
jgi:hypothetical protein